MSKNNKIPHTHTKKIENIFCGKLKLPKLLCYSVKHSVDLSKTVGTWLLCKAMFESGKFEKNATNLNAISLSESICTKTLKTRLNKLLELNLITLHHSIYRLCTWEHFNEVLKVPVTKFGKIQYRYIKKTKKTTYVLLFALAQERKESECKNACNFKLNKDFLIKSEVETVIGRSDSEALEYSQNYHFIKNDLNNDEKFVLYEIARGSSSCSYNYWSSFFHSRSNGRYAYLKRKMIKEGLIVATKRTLQIANKTRTTLESRLDCKIGVCKWTKEKGLALILPDKIEYLNPSLELPQTMQF